MAMVDLATQERAVGMAHLVSVADVACRQQLSPSYLEQLFGKLRRAELVYSARGPGGGYRLARSSSEIAIADIVAAVEEPIKATRCDSGSVGCMLAPGPVAGGEMCQTHDLWFELGRQITLFLCGITLDDVILGRVTGRATSLPPFGTPRNEPPGRLK